MDRPETRYAKSGTTRVAYQVTGSGPWDMVLAPGTVSHLDLDWDWPPRVRFIERLSSFCRLIRFDKRGTGLSDRPTNAATLDERIDDIRAVMDAAGSERAVLFGISEGGSMACLFAATYPDRTRALVLWGVQARWTKTVDYPWGLSRQDQRRMIGDLAERGVTLEYLQGPGAGAGKQADPAFLDWFLRYARSGGSPAAVAALETMNADIDVRDILPSVRAPTLVMNRTGDPVANVAAARDLAYRIPGAAFREWPGESHGLLDIAEEVATTIERFVTAGPMPTPSDRVLATILFVDIVRSTERVSSLGDAGWKRLLESSTETCKSTLDAYRGRWVKGTGDGFLGLFDGPSRGIQCAKEIRRSLQTQGLVTRAGLHTGECETLNGDVGGIAVHLAARIAQAAGPGEILVSPTLRDLVAGAGFTFAERGPTVMKGFPEPVPVFSVG